MHVCALHHDAHDPDRRWSFVFAIARTWKTTDGKAIKNLVITAHEAQGGRNLLVEAYLLQGALLLRQAVPDAAQAAACFQQALAWRAASRPSRGSYALP